MLPSDSSKKRTNKFVFSPVRPKFSEESKDTKNRFEIKSQWQYQAPSDNINKDILKYENKFILKYSIDQIAF